MFFSCYPHVMKRCKNGGKSSYRTSSNPTVFKQLNFVLGRAKGPVDPRTWGGGAAPMAPAGGGPPDPPSTLRKHPAT